MGEGFVEKTPLQLAEERAETYRKALLSIAQSYPEMHGQRLDECYGINDGKMRGILAQFMWETARKTLDMQLGK